MRSLPPAGQREEAAELGGRLQVRADALSKKMADDRRWKRNIPGAFAAAGGIAATAAVAIGPAGPTAAMMDLLTAASVQRWHCHRRAPR
jgi:hypothetical protein